MFKFLISFILVVSPLISWASIAVTPHQNQGFETYTESSTGTQFNCKKQCFIVLGGMEQSEYIKLRGQVSGNGGIGYGYVNGQQIIPGEFVQVSGVKNLDETLLFTKNPYYSQIPKEMPVVIVMEGDLITSDFSQEMGIFSLGESLSRGWNEALSFKEYNPRTINFLEWPMWNGKYINEVFFWWIVFLLCIATLWHFLEKTFDSKTKRGLYSGVSVLVIFWVFFDFFSSVNEYGIYKQVTSAKNIMDNGRVGRSSDFYEFLEFIKTQVPKGVRGAFIAPYPFSFEGKYHVYPDVKFDTFDKVKYLFVYNPYGPQAPFGYKDPVVSSGSLLYESGSYLIEKEISWKGGAKIYILK